jgi:hypothetical protein
MLGCSTRCSCGTSCAPDLVETLRAVAKSHDATLAQVGQVISCPNVVAIRAGSVAQLSERCAADRADRRRDRAADRRVDLQSVRATGAAKMAYEIKRCAHRARPIAAAFIVFGFFAGGWAVAVVDVGAASASRRTTRSVARRRHRRRDRCRGSAVPSPTGGARVT